MRAAWAIGQTAYSLAAVIGATVAMMWALSTPLILDIPGAAESPPTWAFIVAIVAAPISLLISVAIGWIGYARGAFKLTLLGVGLALLNAVAFGLAFGAIVWFCDGGFVCRA